MQSKKMSHGTGAKTKLRTRFVMVLACTMVLCVAGLSLIWEPRVTRVMSTAQVQSLESNVAILSDALVPFLLQNQFAGIFETLESTQTRNANWKQVTLTSKDGRQLYPLIDGGDMDGPDMISTRKSIAFEGRDLAVLTVGVDISAELDQIRRQVRNLTILLSLFFLGSLVTLGLLFERWVVRRVSLLASAARQLSIGNYSANIPEAASDEIGVLTDAFGSMRLTIKENQEKLIASRDEAQRAADAKSNFLAMMSHEIRTPLNGIIPTAELLLEGDLNAEQEQLVGTIQDSGKTLKTVINDILDISKLDEGKFEIRKEEISTHQLVESVGRMFEPAARKKGITLNTAVDGECVDRVLGDGDRLRQVLTNLVGNAVKFTSEGGITITASNCDKNDDLCVRFAVEDTGIGIADEDQDHIFERFSQVDNRSNREYQGSGLGLSICKLLVSALGGALSVESERGKGSCFYFSVPFSAVDTAPAANQSAANGNGHAECYVDVEKVPSSNILVVDDNKTNLMIARAIFSSLKHSVTTVQSGQEALKRLGEEDFDLVLLDINMPGIDGLETAKRIRAGPERVAKTIVLGHSASAFDEDIEQCLKAGMNGFLAKPLSKAELVTELKNHLSVEARRQVI